MSGGEPGRHPRVVVFGCGAVGSVLAARLAKRCPVAVVARGRRLRQIRRLGIAVQGATEASVAVPAAEAPEHLIGFDPHYVLVTVKAPDTAAAARSLASLGNRAVRVSLQNGLGNEEILAADGGPVIGAVNNNGATLLESGRVFHAGLGEVILGAFSGTGGETVRRLQEPLEEVGFPVRAVGDIRGPLWEKAILNAAVNPVTALLGLRSGELLEDPGRKRIVALVVREAVAVARAEGIAISEAEAEETIRRVVRRTASNKSSMLQDLERGAPTEIGSITGVIVQRGTRRGIRTPWNRLLLRLVRAAEDRSAD